jgi:methylmalonyl-CoA mutase N-terminal domain/subunit
MGGAAVAIEKGFFQDCIAKSAYDLQRAQEAGTMTVVGTNRFQDTSPTPSISLPDFSALESRQKGRLANGRARRHAGKAKQSLTAIIAAAKGKDPLMPPIVDAVRARATLGEISDALRGVWGVYRP